MNSQGAGERFAAHEIASRALSVLEYYKTAQLSSISSSYEAKLGRISGIRPKGLFEAPMSFSHPIRCLYARTKPPPKCISRRRILQKHIHSTPRWQKEDENKPLSPEEIFKASRQLESTETPSLSSQFKDAPSTVVLPQPNAGQQAPTSHHTHLLSASC